MPITYGFVKCKVTSEPTLKPSRGPGDNETQYHVHAALSVSDGNGGSQDWDSAVNVGTSDSDDLLRYKLVYDFHHALTATLKAATDGFTDLTGTAALPALDFLRSDVLAGTGPWRDSDPMDGSDSTEPAASLSQLLSKAHAKNADVYIFGRTYQGGDLGVHDVHMNQGSTGSFLNNARNVNRDHNMIWQDGAVIFDFGDPEMVGYFTAFTQQMVPTDAAGNPGGDAHEIDDADPGSLAGA
jgi:uncharacterized protein YukJ